MVDNIEVQKTFFPLSSTVKVSELNQNNANRHQRSFDNQHEEEEGRNTKSKNKHHVSGNTEEGHEHAGSGELLETEEGRETSSRDHHEGIDESGQKKLIDIIV